MTSFKYGLMACLSVLLSACMVVPEVSESYNKKCQQVEKKISLTVEQVDAFHQIHCSNSHECKAEFLGQVAGAVLVLPLSAVVSGSIALIGNSLYWLQEQGQCLKSS